MVGTVESRKSKGDSLLWATVLALISLIFVGNHYLINHSRLLRVLGSLGVGVIAFAIAFRTARFRVLWTLWKESIIEVRKMYWPTRQETLQTTLAVLAMVVVMGLLLWTADFLLLRVVGWLTGHWGV